LPRVSLIMPVFNSITDFERGNGQFMLPQALACIQDQTFDDFELVILDNISTDGTFEFLETYAHSDKRIRLERDTVRRNPEEAISHLSTLITSDYCCIVNDDDHWEKDFLETLYSEITRGGYDLVYPNGYYMDVNSNLEAPLVDKIHPSYNSVDGPISNFTKYLWARNPIPISFGMFRSAIFRKLYPTGTFDFYRANVDNQFILRVIMSGSKVKFLDRNLFNYRNKIRIFNPSKEFGLNLDLSSKDVLENLILHQVKFQHAIRKDIESLVSIEKQDSFIAASRESLGLYIWKMLFFVLDQSNLNKSTYRSLRRICFAFQSELEKFYEYSTNIELDAFKENIKEVAMYPNEKSLGSIKSSETLDLLPTGQRIQLHYLGYRMMRAKTRLASRLKLNIHQ